MFFMHSFQGTMNRAPTQMRESLSYFFQIFKELRVTFISKSQYQNSGCFDMGSLFLFGRDQSRPCQPLASSLASRLLVEDDGIEPTTPCLQSRCSPS